MDNYKQQPWYPLGGLDFSQAVRKDADFDGLDFNKPAMLSHYSREQLFRNVLDPDWVHQIRKSMKSVFDARSPLLNAVTFWRHGHMNKDPFSIGVGTPVHIDQSTVDGKFLGNFSINHYALNWNIDYRPFWDGWKKYANDDWTFTESEFVWFKKAEQFDAVFRGYDSGNNSDFTRINYLDYRPTSAEINRWPRIKLIKILNLTASEAEMYSTKELKETANKSQTVLEYPYYPDSTATMGEKPVLVNTSIPHQSTNKYPKLTISLRWFLPGEDGSKLWPEAVDLFKPWITEF